MQIPIKNFFSNNIPVNKLFLKDENKVFSFATGDKVTIIDTRGGVVIHYTDMVSHIRKQNKVSLRYVYKTKQGDYIASPQITTTFLRSVAYDYFSKNRIVVVSPSITIIFLGQHQDYLVSRDRDEIQSFIDKNFQGLDYVTVPINELVKLVIPDNSKLIALAGGGFLLGLLLIGFTLFKASSPPPPPPHPVTPVQPVQQMSPQQIAMQHTNGFLQFLVNYPLKPYQYISSINFSGYNFKLMSPFPDSPGYEKDGKWYEKTVYYTDNGQTQINKSVEECFNILSQVGQIKTLNNNSIVFQIIKKMDTQQTSQFLEQLVGCPINITGNLSDTLIDAALNMQVTLYGG